MCAHTNPTLRLRRKAKCKERMSDCVCWRAHSVIISFVKCATLGAIAAVFGVKLVARVLVSVAKRHAWHSIV